GSYDRAGSIFLLDLGYNEIESVLVNNIFLAGGIDFYELGNRGRLSNGDSLFHYSFTGKSVSRGTSFFQRIEIQPLTYRPVMTIVNFPDLNIDFKIRKIYNSHNWSICQWLNLNPLKKRSST